MLRTLRSRRRKDRCGRDDSPGSFEPRELKKTYGVELKPRVADAEGRAVRLEGGSELEVDAVIWATGHRPEHSSICLSGT